MNVQPVTLSGQIVRLEPMTIDHVPALARVGLEPELWRLQPRPIETEEDMRECVPRALGGQRLGNIQPFTIIDRASGQVIGSTSYLDIAPEHRRLEIGATWLASLFQRTGANTEAKLLLLTACVRDPGRDSSCLQDRGPQ
ncbi:MAG: GNAT family N-acetyltransferase [Blastocatellia bacterium]